MSAGLMRPAQVLAAATLYERGLRPKFIVRDIGASEKEMKAARQARKRDGLPEPLDYRERGTGTGRGGEPSAQSAITNSVNVIEHTLLLGAFRSALGVTDTELKLYKETDIPPLLRATVFQRYKKQLANLEFLSAYYAKTPSHNQLTMSKAWVLMRDHAAGGISYLTHCSDCRAPFAVHRDQNSSHDCPYCMLTARRKIVRASRGRVLR